MDHKRLFLDIHAIQTLPPSNINRDDTGSPKTAQYGGVTRARVSSQAWKKAMRDSFLKESKRTYDVVKLVANQIREIDPSISEEDAIKYSKNIYDLLEIKLTYIRQYDIEYRVFGNAILDKRVGLQSLFVVEDTLSGTHTYARRVEVCIASVSRQMIRS